MKIALRLSGGVDSSVSLSLLRRQGYRVTAFYLKVWLADELAPGGCPWREDLEYARAVCRREGVELQVLPLQREYFDSVVSYAARTLAGGATPSPDLMCNSRIKFGVFLDRLDPSFSAVATGHYARLEHGPEGPILRRSPDRMKDQTYFLARLAREQLSRLLFPVGGMRKEEVRALAARLGIPSRDRPDSQGLCFLGRVPYRRFVRALLGESRGTIEEAATGRRLGTHPGHWYYTVGQRSGLGLSGGPWYVVRKDAAANLVYVAHRSRMEHFGRTRFPVGRFHWISGLAPDRRGPLLVKLRHGPALLEATLSPPWSASGAPEAAEVRLARPDPGIAPGQFVVFYRGDACLGSAEILPG